ncbi:Lysine--tRNA ligase [Dissostichus eleginoides]|uniref:Lysine--tRNA ligase n=1 Tax=Dissostichus eleginoides TaxID=100907 RepID=A0AAD9B396_DISEL|nr:Lysine--tRNA ligase [Dissostichus eleginoides]
MERREAKAQGPSPTVDSECRSESNSSILCEGLPTAQRTPHIYMCHGHCTPHVEKELHAFLALLPADSAIINHGKEHSRSRLLSAVGRLPPCQFCTVRSLIQENQAQKSRTGNSSTLPPSVLKDLLQPGQSTSP